MEVVAKRRQFFLGGATRAAVFWLGYVQNHQQNSHALTAERDNVLQAIATCQVYVQVWQVAADLALSFHRYMMNAGLWMMWQRCLERLLETGPQEGSLLTRAQLHLHLGEVQARQRRSMEAVSWGEQAVALMQQTGERQYLARCLASLGEWYFNLGCWSKVEELVIEARRLAGPVGDPGTLADTYIFQGRICLERSELAQARDLFLAALEVADAPRRKSGANFLGQVHLKLGQPAQAMSYFRQALAIAQDEGDRPGQGVILSNMGVASLQMGDTDRAQAHLEQSLIITQETDNQGMEAVALRHLGDVQWMVGNREQALHCYQRALEIACRLGDSSRKEAIQQTITQALASEKAVGQCIAR
jgi:tetratricopeptide (TPR) repeat protein